MENLEEHTTIHIQVPVTGMTCAACALSVEKVLKSRRALKIVLSILPTKLFN
jgi:cation transport ATPase